MSSEAIESDINCNDINKRQGAGRNYINEHNRERSEAVPKKSKYVYDLETLLKLQNSPLSNSPIDLNHIPEVARKIKLRDALDYVIPL